MTSAGGGRRAALRRCADAGARTAAGRRGAAAQGAAQRRRVRRPPRRSTGRASRRAPASHARHLSAPRRDVGRTCATRPTTTFFAAAVDWKPEQRDAARRRSIGGASLSQGARRDVLVVECGTAASAHAATLVHRLRAGTLHARPARPGTARGATASRPDSRAWHESSERRTAATPRLPQAVGGTTHAEPPPLAGSSSCPQKPSKTARFNLN